MHWLPLVWLFKHVGVYKLVQTYGWPRLYRRVMSVNRSMCGPDRAKYLSIRDAVQSIFRAPRTMLNVMERHTGVLELLGELERQQLQTPTLLSSLLQLFIRQTKAYGLLARAREIRAKKIRDNEAKPEEE